MTQPPTARAVTSQAGDEGLSKTLSRLEIHLGRLENNFTTLRRLLDDGSGTAAKLLCGVVKKDAYGLGAGQIAHRLSRAGCPMLAVYAPEEAEQLVRQAVVTPILLLMPIETLARTDLLYRHAVAEKLHLSIHQVNQVHQVNQIGRTFGIRMPVHLYLDTGMSRSGLNPDQFAEALALAAACPHLRVAGVYSHLATADGSGTFATRQLKRFQKAVGASSDLLPATACQHIANTYATLRDPSFHLDMVRCGLGLYGYGVDDLKPPMDEPAKLEPIVRWISHLIHVQPYAERTPVGYGSTHRLKRPSVLGVVPVGYGDGYPLALSNKATVRVTTDAGPAECPVLGKVNMDQIVIDLTDIAGDDPPSLVSAPVELISDDPDAANALPALAKLAGVHCYEMLCRLSPHIPRKYIYQ